MPEDRPENIGVDRRALAEDLHKNGVWFPAESRPSGARYEAKMVVGLAAIAEEMTSRRLETNYHDDEGRCHGTNSDGSSFVGDVPVGGARLFLLRPGRLR